MGCGANLKVAAAISNPNEKRESVEVPERRVRHNRFKLSPEVLTGFENLLKVVTRKTAGKRRKPNHLTDVPEPAGPSVVSDGPTLRELQHEEATLRKQVSVLGTIPESAPPPKFDKADTSWVVEKESKDTGHNGDSLFQHVNEHLDDKPKDLEEVKAANGNVMTRPQEFDESELMSPEAPGMLSEDDEISIDNESRRAARIEMEKNVQIEATRLAAGKRHEEEQLLSEKKGEMEKMEGQASAILSKYS